MANYGSAKISATNSLIWEKERKRYSFSFTPQKVQWMLKWLVMRKEQNNSRNSYLEMEHFRNNAKNSLISCTASTAHESYVQDVRKVAENPNFFLQKPILMEEFRALTFSALIEHRVLKCSNHGCLVALKCTPSQKPDFRGFSLLYATQAPSLEYQHPEAWPTSTYGHLRGVSLNKKCTQSAVVTLTVIFLSLKTLKNLQREEVKLNQLTKWRKSWVRELTELRKTVILRKIWIFWM